LQDDGVDQPERGATGTVTAAKGARQTSLGRGPPAWVGGDALPGAVDEVVGVGGVVLVAAEPGTGKTTLLRRWLAGREPGASRATIARGDRPDEVAQALRHLRFGDVGVVVVDDATALGDDGLVGLGARIAGRAAAVGVVLSGRAELGLCTSELRERGPLLELDGTDLAWDAEAVRAALEGWGWEDVTGDEATAVAARTDGWPAAVRLVAAAGRDQPWEAHLIDTVRELVSDAELDDLLRLSLADTLDDGAVTALLGDGDGRLAELWRRRLFVRPGAQPGTLRFVTPVHHALRRELAARPPSLGADARRGAARHAAAAAAAAAPLGAPADADMGAALLSDDMLAAQALELMLAGRLVAPAPAALGAAAAASPLGRTAASLALLDAGDVDLARAALPGAGAAHDAGPVLAEAHALLAARRDDDLAATAAYAARLARASRAHARLEALAWLQLGTLEHDLGWDAPADEHLRLAASLADRAGAPSLLAQARAVRATLAATNGHLREAERLARSVPVAEPRAETRMRRAVALAHVAFLRDDLALAQEHLAVARAAAMRTRDPHVWSALLFLDLVVLDALGEDDRAFERLAEATAARARCARRPHHDRTLALYRVRLLDRAGRSAEADAERTRLRAGDDPLVGLAFARRALERGDATAATRALSSSASVPADAAWELRVSHLAVRALAADRLGDPDAAHATLEEALELTAPEGLVRPFLEDGIRLRDLLGRHRATGTAHAAFAGELIARLTGARPTPDARLLHPLTEREVVVLGYLPTPLTAAEIAAELFVAEATVRTHMRHIYDKLGVAGRREAVERGRDLGIRARVSW
jgi:LuxR family maltose regulon positive regulatory protein